MICKFLRDYRGRETKENFVREGETWDINLKEIRHLVNEEVIEKPGDDVWQKLVAAEGKAPAKQSDGKKGTPNTRASEDSGPSASPLPLPEAGREEEAEAAGEGETATAPELPLDGEEET